MSMKLTTVTSPTGLIVQALLQYPEGTVIETKTADGRWALHVLRGEGGRTSRAVARLGTSDPSTNGRPVEAHPQVLTGALAQVIQAADTVSILTPETPPEPADPVGEATRIDVAHKAVRDWLATEYGIKAQPEDSFRLRKVLEAAL